MGPQAWCGPGDWTMKDKTRDAALMQVTSNEAGETEVSSLPLEIQEQLGKQLRQVYGKLLSEPLPDKFSKLLDALSKTESKE